MRVLTALFLLAASPALAHNEIVVTASLMPLAFGVASIALSFGVVFRKMARKRIVRR